MWLRSIKYTTQDNFKFHKGVNSDEFVCLTQVAFSPAMVRFRDVVKLQY